MYVTRKNPKTGMLETYELPEPPDIEISRRDFREFITGSYQWHDDPYAKAKQIEIKFESDQDEDWIDIYSASIP